MIGATAFSDDRQHRYRLTRYWDRSKPRVLWVMMNPSNGDHLRDDPTIRRVQRFSQSLGFGSLDIVNLFSRIAADPEDLIGLSAPELIGPENERHWEEAKAEAGTVIGGWGAMKVFDEESARARALQAISFFGEIESLEVTAGFMPKHPLYIEKGATLSPYARAGKPVAGYLLGLDAIVTDSGKIDAHE